MNRDNATEQSIFIQTTSDEKQEWNKQKIIDSLLKETTINPVDAEKVADIIEKKLKSMELPFYTSDLVREIINMYLLEQGHSDICVQYQRLGMSLYDVDNFIIGHNKENANVPKGPEATNLAIAEHIKKNYALAKVFSKDISDAYLDGKIHLHDMGMIDRNYCSAHNPAYVAKYGLDFPTSLSSAKPAKTAEILIEHIVKHSAMMQCNFAGAIGWDAVNTFIAPYLVGYSYKQIKQCAQMMVFEFAQQAVARGGQAVFSDLNVFWEIPAHYADVDAIGPGGKMTGKKYKDYLKESQAFATALFEVYREGDAAGRPFFFPKAQVHITDNFFKTDGHEDFLRLICQVASEKGNTYFIFERGKHTKISMCCRLSFDMTDDDLEDMKTPWKVRHTATNIVTINLPRMALESTNEDELLSNITESMVLGVRANVERREFLKGLMKQGKEGNLAILCMDHDGEPYWRSDKSKGLIGMVGLNECVQLMIGKELHEGMDAQMLGLKIISHMNKECQRLSKEYDMQTILEQTPAESTAYRFAKMDKDRFDRIKDVVKGNPDTDDIYYTNSTYLNIGADISVIERIKAEGKFHPMIPAGSMTHVWMGENLPDVEGVMSLVRKTFENTSNNQISFSPDFTTCYSCNRTERGLYDKCPLCGSKDIEGISRVTGYFSKISQWNKGKRSELKDRKRNAI